MTAQRDPETIARELDQHRDELARTLDDISVKISPKRVAAKGKNALLHSTKGRAVLAGVGGLVAVAAAAKAVQSFRGRRRHPLSPHKP